MQTHGSRAREWIKGKNGIFHEVEEPRHFKEALPPHPRCDFSEKILPIDDDDGNVDGMAPRVYIRRKSLSLASGRAGGCVCGKQETDSRKVERKSVGDTAGKEKG